MEYKKRLILFIDILGFKDFIYKTKQNYLNEISGFIDLINSLSYDLNINPKDEERIKIKLQSSENISISQFSDSIVISINDENGLLFEQLIFDVLNILCTGYYYGFMFRGAITLGEIWHDGNVMFGPGFIQAFNLEQKLAIYPRVIIDSNIYSSKSINYSSNCLDGIIKKDFDGIEYINPFFGIDKKYGESDTKEILIGKIKEIISRIDTVDDYVKPKYEWLKNKYNDYIGII